MNCTLCGVPLHDTGENWEHADEIELFPHEPTAPIDPTKRAER